MTDQHSQEPERPEIPAASEGPERPEGPEGPPDTPAEASPQANVVRSQRGLNIGAKLTIGFGALVVLLLVVGLLSYLASATATTNIDSTIDARVPIANTSESARANLLRMISDVRGYLALGDDDSQFRQSYEQSREAFEQDLEELERLSPSFTRANQRRYEELQDAYARWTDEDWAGYPQTLFALRDDQLEREPAYNTLVIEGSALAANVLLDTNLLIETQGQMEPTRENLELLEDMAKFQGSFAAIFSGLRGYVTTRNRDFLLEYEANRDINDENWSRLLRQSDQLTETQQIIFARISENRAEFLELPPEIIEILESERWREDLYLFRTETIPLADRMQELLDEMATDDQQLLEELLNEGRDELVIANQQTLISSVIALLLGGGLALLFTANITGPVRRLTSTARQIQEGNLDARADVRTGDELGVLAGTFNAMTSQIQQNLIQIQREKKRADDLLHVVIPIGVALSSEKDFNRLLESILIEARQFCNADAGVLYLRTADNQLQCMIVRNDSQQIAMGGTTQQTPPFAPLPLTPTTEEPLPQQDVAAYAALHGISVNIAQTDESDEEAPFTPSTIFDGEQNGYHTISQLTIPLKNSQEEIKGVLQLVNAQDPETGQIIPFDQNLQQMMESLSSLAVAALEAYIREQSLRQEIQELRIEIDEVKRTKQVSEIVDTELFQDLQSKARHLRNRRRRQSSDPDPDQSQET